MSAKIVLASASPRRKELLRQIGLDFDVIPSLAEETVLPEETPEQLVVRLSLAKAREVAGRKEVAGRWFIGSDTIVLCDGIILGKPEDEAHATAMLRKLSGREHQVLSGYAVIDRESGREIAEAVSTRVRFRRLTDGEIARYIATGEPADKAGSYAIQGLGVCFVAGIEGSYTNVVGLPLCRLTLALEELGVPTFLNEDSRFKEQGSR
ncbi:MAG: septum formation inhibitor Maf [Desulfuromonas sp.]|nr:MAG: septum formation inhibitor Maf [Desulfuromonas sp.]